MSHRGNISSLEATMSSIHPLRVFINERLTAAAEEIFTVVEQTIVQYEEEIHRQHEFQEINWKRQIKLHRPELPQRRECTEKQLFKLVTNSCLEQGEPQPPQINEEQEEPEPPQIKDEPEEPELLQLREEQGEPESPQIKEEQEEPEFPQIEYEEPGTSQDGERPLLKFESEIPSIEEESYLREPEEVPVTEHFLSRDSSVHHLKKHTDSKLVPNAEPKKILIFYCNRVDNVPALEKQAEREKLLCEQTCGEIVRQKRKPRQNLGTVIVKKRTCEVCGRGYKQNVDLLRHMRTHTGEKPYPCEICGKRFSLQGNVLIHMRIHTGEKPYPCETCGKSFSVQSTLVAHIRTHTGEKPYSCQTCGKSFRKQNALSSHIRTHTGEKPYSCQTCGKSFSIHSNLLVHIRTHTGEKPYSCEMCGKCFGERSGLRTHLRTHSPERPYSCETCGMRFTHRSSLLRHVKTHRGETMKDSMGDVIQEVKV